MSLRSAFGVAAFLLAVGAQAQIVVGQTDTFPVDTMSWQGAHPSWVSTGGPGGAGDSFLQLVSTGGSGPGSNMALNNSSQWSGDYTSAGVGSISADFENLGDTQLIMRLTFFDSNDSTQWVSSSFITLDPGTGWQHFTYAIDPGQFIQTEGTTSFADTMSNVHRMMFRHDPVGSSGGTSIVATLGVDNIHAAPVPEPASLAVVGLGVLALLRRRR
ncbi:MAG TPA: PEP-CTERM sorting domain-containing protein [Fimbriimonadaceae bacterium]|nr:PEP-CTERM sorting domain-containing protein [Fimbriimonadaceae bacterium]